MVSKGLGLREALGQFGVLVAGVHHAHVGDIAARKVVARHLHAESVALELFEQGGGYALGGLAEAVAGEHAVDVRIVHGPEAFAYVRGEGVGRGHDEYLVAGHEVAALFKVHERADELGADELRLELVAAHGAHDGDALFAGAEAEALYAEFVAEGGGQDEEEFAFHHFTSL